MYTSLLAGILMALLIVAACGVYIAVKLTYIEQDVRAIAASNIVKESN